MNKKTLMGIIVGLMVATSAVYFVETIEEFEEGDMIKGPFFLVVAIAYIPVAYLMISKNSSIPYVVVIVGSVGIMVLYAITRTDMAMALGMEAGRVGHLGIVSKTLQIGIVFGSLLTLIQFKKDVSLKSKLEKVKYD
jgi:hypothetical protein